MEILWVSMVFLWDFYGGPCKFFGISKGFQRDVYGISIGFLCDFYGIPIMFLWDFVGVPMGFR
jgi:hypothetical protein